MTDLPMPTVPRPDASVRPARRGDAAGLAAETLASWRGQYAEVLPVAATELTEAELEQRWADALAATPVLAAFEGDAVVGLVLLAPCDDPDLEGENCAEIVELAVHPDATRRGHGSRLLAAAVDRARTDGRASLVTWCGVGDLPRHAFLTSTGFADDGASRTLGDGVTAWEQIRLSAYLDGA